MPEEHIEELKDRWRDVVVDLKRLAREAGDIWKKTFEGEDEDFQEPANMIEEETRKTEDL